MCQFAFVTKQTQSTDDATEFEGRTGAFTVNSLETELSTFVCLLIIPSLITFTYHFIVVWL